MGHLTRRDGRAAGRVPGIYVGQLITGDEAKDPDVLAERIWQLHSKRDQLRDQVSED